MKRSLFVFALLLAARSGCAEIAVLDSGTTLKVVARRADGETLFLTLKEGGEVGVPASFVRGFVPDEVLDEVAPATNDTDLSSLAVAAARRHGLDPQLVLAVVAVESAFRTDAVSRKGAQGLMQLMPATAADLGVADALDPAQNLDAGARHLGSLLNLYDGDVRKALAAYNAGAGAVGRYRGIPPYPETRDYVSKVLRRYGRKP